MDYKNMLEITKYCENNGIDLDKELMDILISIKSINKKLFPFLKLESELAKRLLWCYANFEEELSPLFERVDIDFEEILYCLKLIASGNTQKSMQEMCLVCLNDAIREDKVALNLIASQKKRFHIRELRLACENATIRQDKVALNLIASQETWECMEEMHLVCENDALRQNKELLHFIASKETWEEMRQIWLAYIDGVSLAELKEMYKNSLDEIITKERARLDQELSELLRIRKTKALQDLFQENPDLNSETPIKR